MVSEPIKLWKSPYITLSDDFPNQNLPTDSADEAFKRCSISSSKLGVRRRVPRGVRSSAGLDIYCCWRALRRLWSAFFTDRKISCASSGDQPNLTLSAFTKLWSGTAP